MQQKTIKNETQKPTDGYSQHPSIYVWLIIIFIALSGIFPLVWSWIYALPPKTFSDYIPFALPTGILLIIYIVFLVT